MHNHFSILDWSAFAPGLETPEQWRAWSAAPWLPEGEAIAALEEMPALQRRRLAPLGRLALQVAWRCQPVGRDDVPLVFASRHGDIGRTFEMLAALARDEPLSPTHFGLSTHNAIAAQYSITRVLTGNYLALSGGAESAEAAITEALALLADGCPEVLVVVYDGPIPGAYAEFRDEPECAWAWAWRIGRAQPGRPSWSLEPPSGTAQARPATRLPHGLDLLRFVLSDETQLAAPASARRWQRHG